MTTTSDPQRPWLSSYAPGVPHELPLPTTSLADLIAESVRTYPDRPAIEFFGAATTYAELGDRSTAPRRVCAASA